MFTKTGIPHSDCVAAPPCAGGGLGRKRPAIDTLSKAKPNGSSLSRPHQTNLCHLCASPRTLDCIASNQRRASRRFARHDAICRRRRSQEYRSLIARLVGNAIGRSLLYRSHATFHLQRRKMAIPQRLRSARRTQRRYTGKSVCRAFYSL